MTKFNALMNLKAVWSFAVILVFLLLAFPDKTVFAQDSSLQSQMINLKLEAIVSQGNAVSGSVTVINNSNKNFSEGYLVVSLLSPGTTTTLKSGGQDIAIQSPGQLIEFNKSEFFPVKPGDTITKPISLKYPPTIKTGQYNLIVEIKDKDGSSQGSISTKIDLTGSGDFLDVSQTSCKITVGDKAFNPTEGPNVSKDETAVLTCTVKNSLNHSVEAKPEVVYAVNSVAGDNASATPLSLASVITVGAGQTGSVKVTIPKNLPPQVYEGMLFLVDNAGQRISANIPFRWIITGPSAVIRNLDLDRSYYKSGQVAKVSVLALPSVDLSWRGGSRPQNPGYSGTAGTDLKNPKISLRILNSNNQLCGQKEEALPSTTQLISWKEKQIDIPITQECKNPKVEAAIYEEGITLPLATLTKGAVTTESDLQVAAPKIGKDIPWIWLLAGLVIAAAAGFIFWRKRKKSPPAPPGSGAASNAPSVTTPSSIDKPITAGLIIAAMLGVFWAGQNKTIFKNPFIVHAQQQFSSFQGGKQPVNNTDSNTKTLSVQRIDSRFGGTVPLAPTEWANVRDFAENGTGGDSSVVVSPDCRSAKITIRGTSTSDFVCTNWASGIAIANFVDSQPATPSALTPLDQSEVLIPSLQISPSAFDNYSTYGPHILNIHQFNSSGPRGANYTLNFPNGLSEGTHKLLIQAAASNLTSHLTGIDRYFSSFERLASTSAQPAASGSAVLDLNNNCGGNEPCFINLEREFSCGPIPACNQSCSDQKDCAYAPNGCTQCRPTPDGQNTCQPPPPACNASCSSDKDCFGNKDGCSACVNGACKVPPACNSSCTSDSDCSKAVDGCTACVGGSCKTPPACGTSCTTKADCSGVKNSCSECLEGTCTDFNDNMCKCDGITADMTYPGGGNFKFETFGKVEGTDTKKAEIADITFRMTKDNQVIAKSDPITPQIVETSDTKTRFKANWQTAPPAISKNSTYRVFADVRCKPKRITADAGAQPFSPAPKQALSLPPKGLELIINTVNKIFSSPKLAGITTKVLAMFSTSTVQAQGTNLQLQTLNFVKLMDTDNCRFVMFKYDETLF